MWADIELTVMLWLRSQLPGVRVTDELPDKVETRLPLIWVRVVGGGDDRISDTATVDVQAFAADRAAMWQLAERARAAMLAAGAQWVPGARVVIDTVDTIERPNEVPYGNPALRRAVASYALTSRAQASA
ncbi:hypothetical protein [Streptomyces sp. NPDC059883]|uniref:hypothetical protein n=1 Tax=unclassified Streptomyces TaxID=2593676 RepID=UPI00364A1887